LVDNPHMSKRAVILAGGKASRLGPYSTVLPKPLLPIGDRPVLEIVLRRLHAAGFETATLAVGYLSHLVRAVIADGAGLGIEIDYHEESSPLGTIGPLREIEGLDDTFLVMNGDVLTTLDFVELLHEHQTAGNMLTLASHQRTIRTEYGVLRVDESHPAPRTREVVGFEEKPELSYTVSMGVYAMEPGILDYIPDGKFDLPDLVVRLVEAGEQVGHYPFDGRWFDLGRSDDYQEANNEVELLGGSVPPAVDAYEIAKPELPSGGAR
jgi:NDP-sugar pyrophosphorylase family protein